MGSSGSNKQHIAKVIDSLERLPKEEQEIVFQKLEFFQGDLPHPDILAGYDRLCPGAAEKIINNGIAESEHRREMEKTLMEERRADRRLGVILGFILALLIIIVGAFLIYKGKTVVGSILSGVTALGIVGLFTGGKTLS